MNLLKTFFVAAVMITSYGSAYAIQSCSAAQWASGDRACAIVNGAGSCATSCSATSGTSSTVGCSGGGIITVSTIELDATVGLEPIVDEGNGKDDVIYIQDAKDFRVKDLKGFYNKK